MTNCLFYSLFFTLFLSFGIGSIRFSNLNYTFENMLRGIFEASACYIDKNGNPTKPYFDKDYLIDYVTMYLKDNIKNHLDYEALVYFYNDDEHQTFCTSEYCANVKITLKCRINYFFTFDKTKDYKLVQNYAK